MSTTATPLAGTFTSDPVHSSFGFAVKYQGISIFQERSANVDLNISGQGGMQISGTFYVAGGPIKITGSNATNLDIIGSQYISRTLQSGGNGSYTVDWNPDKTARLRQLALVE